MTANELIVLLEIYRGTFAHANNMGTINQDIEHLIRWGFIEHDFRKREQGSLVTTAKGHSFIEHMLNHTFHVKQ